MTPVTTGDLVNYYRALIAVPKASRSKKIKEVIERIEEELHFNIMGMRRTEFK